MVKTVGISVSKLKVLQVPVYKQSVVDEEYWKTLQLSKNKLALPYIFLGKPIPRLVRLDGWYLDCDQSLIQHILFKSTIKLIDTTTAVRPIDTIILSRFLAEYKQYLNILSGLYIDSASVICTGELDTKFVFMTHDNRYYFVFNSNSDDRILYPFSETYFESDEYDEVKVMTGYNKYNTITIQELKGIISTISSKTVGEYALQYHL